MSYIKSELLILKDIYLNHKIESIIIAITGLVCLLSFNYMDGLSLTVWSVEFWDMLFNGNNQNFQEVFVENLRNSPHSGDGISGTVLFSSFPWAIWNFPLWLTHSFGSNTNILTMPCLIWSKFFLMLCSVVSALQCYHIVDFFTSNKKNSRLTALFFLGSGTLVISVGYSMQNEIFYILSFLISLRYFFNNRFYLSMLWLCIAVTQCPFMILPALFILLVKEKNIIKLFLYCILLLGPYYLLDIFFPAINPIRDNYFDWFFGRTTIFTGFGAVSIFAITLIFMYCLAYFRDYQSLNERNQMLLHYITILMVILCFMSWLHFYRYFICIPFALMSIAVVCKNNNAKLLASLTLLTVFEFARTLGAAFFDENCWTARYIVPLFKEKLGIEHSLSFGNIINLFAPSLVLYIKCLVGSVIIAITIFLLLLFINKNINIFIPKISVNLISRIYVLIPIFIICCLFFLSFHTMVFSLSIYSNNILATPISNDRCLNEYYLSSGESLKSIQIRPVTWGRKYPDDLKIYLQILERDTNVEVGSAEIAANSLPNNNYISFEISDVKLKANKWYVFRLSAIGTMENEEQYIYLLRSDDNTANFERHFSTESDLHTNLELQRSYDIISQIVSWKF